MRNVFKSLELIIPLGVVIVSLVFVVNLWPRSSSVQPALARNMPVPGQVISDQPTQLAIPSLQLKLPVMPGTYNTQAKTWTLDDRHVFVKADMPNVSNDPKAALSFLYGHDTSAVLGKTSQLRVGDKLVITTKNNHRFTYIFTQAFVVEPTDAKVLTDKTYGQLALLSCEGITSDKRRVMYFDFEKVEKL